ncbi:MAG TPA: 50S ribosomal protein L5 [Anaerolineaceae bacterium]|jgi:large subunit ribosomal protein L5|nr:50S ribosomal protein L5 [Longilinea sp.]NMD31503.1 50S ribosomal protein L5 [Chloroflexota bacterium]HNZ00655.1 50S ribosomal protein L5 [Anaerolineaceae bacterium]HOD43392.1 50S ribosomal protein L5 [Anaerolineaceae bacterium]HOH20022.1 50S ribosomal protein L5 [Anaerolineaceae bacterium]
MNHMKERYQNEVVPALMKALNLDNVMDVPRIQKVVVNIGMGEAMDNPKALEAATTDISAITGQRPVVTKARKSIAAFKLREGRSIGVMVTLRGEKMWSFLDRLMNIVLPRVRDFRGISPNAFDGRGNYTLGLREQIIFPEIEYDKVDKVRGMEITIVTTARTDDRAAMLLQLLGMPFRKD